MYAPFTVWYYIGVRGNATSEHITNQKETIMYKYKYYNPTNINDPELAPRVIEPYEHNDKPRITIRLITAEYANALHLITDLEMSLRARLREVKMKLRERPDWDTKHNNGYIEELQQIIDTIEHNTIDLTRTDFNVYGDTLREVEDGECWFTYQEYLNCLAPLFSAAEGALKKVVETYNEIVEEAETLLACTLNTRKRTWV